MELSEEISAEITELPIEAEQLRIFAKRISMARQFELTATQGIYLGKIFTQQFRSQKIHYPSEGPWTNFFLAVAFVESIALITSLGFPRN